MKEWKSKKRKKHVYPILKPLLYLLNFRKRVNIVNFDDVRSRRKSDTLFILGSGNAIRDVTPEEWSVIGNYDSLALSYFIFHDFIPTYIHVEVPKNSYLRKKTETLIQSKREQYKNVIRLVSLRDKKHGMSPFILPKLFIDDQLVSYFEYPRLVTCPKDRAFRKSDFEGRFMYRGGLNLCLYIGLRLKYNRIILLGCEMNNNIYFYENMAIARWVVEANERFVPLVKWDSAENRAKQKYEGMYETKGKHPFDKTIYAFNEFVLRPNGVELFVARRESSLYPRIPYIEVSSYQEK